MSTSFPADAVIRKILVCQLRQIGDVILTTPALELLQRRFPQAQIHVLTEKKCLPVLEHNPHVARVWPIDKKALPNLWTELRYYRQIARENFDLVVDFQQLPRCRWVVAFSRAPYRLSYPPAWYKRPLYNIRYEPAKAYAAQQKANLLNPLGITWQGETPKIFLTEEERQNAAIMLKDAGLAPHERLITVDPTHIRATRCWPAEHFAKLLDLVAEHDGSMRFLLLYGPGEEEVVAAVADNMERQDNLLRMERMLTLREMFAVQAKSCLHVGNCSAPRHSAVAVGTPTLTILGATSRNWTFPSLGHQDVSMGLSCQPCNKHDCPIGIKCLRELAPETVFITLRDMLPPPIVPLEA